MVFEEGYLVLKYAGLLGYINFELSYLYDSSSFSFSLSVCFALGEADTSEEY